MVSTRRPASYCLPRRTGRKFSTLPCSAPAASTALGYTIQHPTEDRFVLAASELRNRIAVLMGGRAAEALLFEGDISTGAADDLQRATDIATEMVTLYGMAETVGQRAYKPAPQGFLAGQVLDKPVASEVTLREIDLCVRDFVADAFAEARAILTRRRADLDQGADLLLKKEAITAEDFPAIQQTKPGGKAPGAPAASA
jgi:cell division protease FtsH